MLLVRLDRYAEAEAHFDAALKADASNEGYRLNLAVARLKSESYESAIPELEKLAAGAPDDATYRAYLGRSYHAVGRHEDVIALLEPWLAGADQTGENVVGDSGSPGATRASLGDAYDALAMSLRALGELDKATVYVEKAVELEPDNAPYLNNYGVILAENGRIEEAKAQWKKVLRLEPDNAVAKQNLLAVE